ncbi:hypothetical protein POZ03_01425 [Bacteroides uniformis]|uniref:hypothetical protein n=1 Tax=Bacteroides uniformis TaxID=820 RepID=UPI00233F4E22|nr:hypothetical protein [Bacteroides uniformis]MDC1809117.1 hypothetical protein [Bacteroides uniformis]
MLDTETVMRRIIAKTGRNPISCSCEICQAQCRRAPCLGTPQDIWRLIKAGYKDKLSFTLWNVGYIVGEIDFGIPMVQPKLTPYGCIFFRNGLCELHDLGLKPTEGKLSHHTLGIDNLEFSMTLSWNVAKEWMNKENAKVIVDVIMHFA